MVTALIFAGGAGVRMNMKSKPKQFLEVYGKPIIISTIEHFEYHEQVDNIVVVCIEEGIKTLKSLIKKYELEKITSIVSGGKTSQESIFKGLKEIEKTAKEDDIVLIHDGVRPLITRELISLNIENVKKYGNSITCEPVRESSIRSVDGKEIYEVPPREQMYTAKAPQSFYFMEILKIYEQARKDNVQSVDSSHLCSIYKKKLYITPSNKNNIKITEPSDYYVYKALYDVEESKQIFGF